MSGDMTEFVSALTTGFSSDAMWSTLLPMAPLIIAVGLFSLGLYFTRRTTRGAARGHLRF